MAERGGTAGRNRTTEKSSVSADARKRSFSWAFCTLSGEWPKAKAAPAHGGGSRRRAVPFLRATPGMAEANRGAREGGLLFHLGFAAVGGSWRRFAKAGGSFFAGDSGDGGGKPLGAGRRLAIPPGLRGRWRLMAAVREGGRFLFCGRFRGWRRQTAGRGKAACYSTRTSQRSSRPLVDWAAISHVPGATAVTRPVSSTVATAGSDDDHVTDRSSA